MEASTRRNQSINRVAFVRSLEPSSQVFCYVIYIFCPHKRSRVLPDESFRLTAADLSRSEVREHIPNDELVAHEPQLPLMQGTMLCRELPRKLHCHERRMNGCVDACPLSGLAGVPNTDRARIRLRVLGWCAANHGFELRSRARGEREAMDMRTDHLKYLLFGDQGPLPFIYSTAWRILKLCFTFVNNDNLVRLRRFASSRLRSEVRR